jgi:hypothetical protein
VTERVKSKSKLASPALAPENISAVTQALRCYMTPRGGWGAEQKREASRREAIKRNKSYRESQHSPHEEKAIEKEIRERARYHAGFTLTFDTETFRFKHGQSARYGIYQLRGIPGDVRMRMHKNLAKYPRNAGGDAAFRNELNAPFEIGLFYNPDLFEPENNGAELRELEAFRDKFNRERHDPKNFDPLTDKKFPEMKLMHVADFVKDVFYLLADELGVDGDLIIVGHNIAFDFGALSTYAGLARGERWAGGFSLKLCRCNSEGKVCYLHPAVRIKPFGSKKRKFGFATGKKPGSKQTMPKIETNFVDTNQLASALLGAGTPTSLWYLSHVQFKDEVKTKKEEFDEFDGPVNEKALRYCFGDVQCSFEVYVQLARFYAERGLSKPIWEIYSEASLGKGYYEDLGIPRFLAAHPDFPSSILGCAMQSFYGGRSEVRIRNQETEVLFCDFKSQYPTVNALMKLQEHVLAKTYEIRCAQVPHWVEDIIRVAGGDNRQLQTREQLDFLKAQAAYFCEDGRCQALRKLLDNKCYLAAVIGSSFKYYASQIWPELLETAQAAKAACEQTPAAHLDNVRAFLENTSFDDLRKQSVRENPLMKSLVLIAPAKGDILPERAGYDDDNSLNIGANEVIDGPPAWWAMADALASKITSRQTPRIIDAITVYPIGQVETNEIDLFAEKFSLKNGDFFTQIINRRTAIQKKRDELVGRSKAQPANALENNAAESLYDAEIKQFTASERALKLLANSTAYGILVELNVDDRTGDYRKKPIAGDDSDEDYDDDFEEDAVEKFLAATNKGFAVDLYDGAPVCREIKVGKFEKPGTHFAPHIATHITAGGRLLLAICERLAADRGIGYVFCDTDSMTFARPRDMERDKFHASVDEIVNWFAPLYPYSPAHDDNGKPLSILNYEDVNNHPDIRKKSREPVYCIAVSAKRYALYNFVPLAEVKRSATPFQLEHLNRFIADYLDGEEPEFYPLFRKVSAHGTGFVTQPSDYQISMPKPEFEPRRERDEKGKPTGKGKALTSNARADEMLGDVWRKFVLATSANKPLILADPQLEQPIIAHISLGSADYWKRFRNLPRRRPFQFFSAIPPLIMKSLSGRNEFADEELALSKRGFYAPSADRFANLSCEIYRADNQERFDLEAFIEKMAARENVEVRIPTFGDFFRGVRKSAGIVRRGYFENRENKSFPADGTGLLARKRLIVAQTILIAKESNELRDDQAEATLSAGAGSDEDAWLSRAGRFYGKSLSYFNLTDLRTIADKTNLSLAQLQRYRDDPASTPGRAAARNIVRAMKEIANAKQRGRTIETQGSKKRDQQKQQQVLRDAINGLGIAWWYDCPEIGNCKELKIPHLPTELDYRDLDNPGKERIVRRLFSQGIKRHNSNATKEAFYELKTLIGNFMHKTALAEDDFKRVSKALNDEIDLENRIAQHPRKNRYLPNGTSFRVVRHFIVYDRGRSPGLVWERERSDEAGNLSVADA